MQFWTERPSHMPTKEVAKWYDTGLILGLRPANERRHYKVTRSLIGSVQTYNQPCDIYFSLHEAYIVVCMEVVSFTFSGLGISNSYFVYTVNVSMSIYFQIFHRP